MQFDLWTFGLQTINFIILVWILKVFLYQPVLKAIEQRQAENMEAQNKAELARKESEKDSEYYKARVSQIEEERDQVIAEARIAESRAYDKLISDGQNEVTRLRELARKDIARSKSKARAEMQQHATELAVTLTRRILEESSTEEINEIFLDRVVNHLKSMPVADVKSLQDQLIEHPLTITSAEKLKVDVEEKWRKVIAGVFGRKVGVIFEVDERLLAGVNLQFSDGLLSFNWNDILDQAKETLYKQPGHM